jgi:hypothetical protein
MAGTITHEWNGTVLTITSDSGTSSADLKGEKGDMGVRGAQGIAGNGEGVDLSNYYTKAEIDAIIAAISGGGGGESSTITFRIGDEFDGGDTIYTTYTTKSGNTWAEAISDGDLPNYSIGSLADYMGLEGDGIYCDAQAAMVAHGDTQAYVKPTETIESKDYELY